MAVKSEKVHVFEAIFKARYDAKTGKLSKSLVMLDEVADTIRQLVASGTIELSDRNPANFIKDYLRSASRNTSWPELIRVAGFTARQRTGVGQCFEFVALSEGEELFPDDFQISGNEPEFTIQTLSLPITTREIVRADEQSVAQIAVKLHILEHFFASSPTARSWGLCGVTHLQNNVKLRSAEIDALYQAELKREKTLETGAITVEVKIGDPIIKEQIAHQVAAVFADDSIAFCVPAILKRFKKGELVAMHLPIIRRSDLNPAGEATLGSVVYSAKYAFQPPLPKI